MGSSVSDISVAPCFRPGKQNGRLHRRSGTTGRFLSRNSKRFLFRAAFRPARDSNLRHASPEPGSQKTQNAENKVNTFLKKHSTTLLFANVSCRVRPWSDSGLG